MVNIVVCIKQVPDPEVPASVYRIDEGGKRVLVPGAPPVLSPFDENALEAALQLKDEHEGKITVISMGQGLSKATLRKSLAAGADELILLEDELFWDADSYSTAFTLATAMRKIAEYDLIFTGIQAADTNNGVVGPGIAEILNMPIVTSASKVELENSRLRVERIVSDGYELIEVPLPALVTVSNQVGDLRPTDVRALMAAQKKPITTWNAEQLGIISPLTRRVKLHKLFIPKKEQACEIMPGETPEDAGVNLALKLRQVKII
jgi:electron transfer flavoprotein beta subunit